MKNEHQIYSVNGTEYRSCNLKIIISLEYGSIVIAVSQLQCVEVKPTVVDGRNTISETGFQYLLRCTARL
jgi:hypothetical protein